MRLLAIDPGTDKSAMVIMDRNGKPAEHYIWPNLGVLCYLRQIEQQDNFTVVIEEIASYGMPVGAEVFRTVRWCGQFEEAARQAAVYFVPRREVKLHLCGQARAKDANIRQAVLDRFGGKEVAIGRTKARGPLFGMKADEWQALALAVTWLDLYAPVEADVKVTRRIEAASPATR